METVSDPSIAMAESKWRRDMIDDRNDRPAVGDIAGAKRDRSEDGDRFAKRGIRQILGTMMMLAMMATGLDQVTAFSAVAATLNNLGPGLGDVASGFMSLSDTAKWISVAGMLLGRLEIFTLLVLITPTFWRT